MLMVGIKSFFGRCVPSFLTPWARCFREDSSLTSEFTLELIGDISGNGENSTPVE